MSITHPTPVTPWGSSRLAPYRNTVQLPYATVTIDPATQLGVARDRNGHVVEMGQHGTAQATGTSETTSPDGNKDATDQRSDQDDKQD